MTSPRVVLFLGLSMFALAACGGDEPAPAGDSLPDAAHTVGGTVSGLKGTGLVLINNGGDQLAVSADGNFVFAKPVSDGGAYAVQVAVQPADPQQTCTVTKGDGMVNGADVTNVSVTCASGSFTIGGSLSGLSPNRQIKLRINGGDELTLTSDGTFEFTTPLEDGTGYAVSVQAQPTGETCSVNNGSGTLQGADVTNVEVTCVVNLYSVGGSVSGLAGTGLTLKLNNAESLPISADGGFAFTTPFTYSSAYSVTVATQPTSPKQTCSLAGQSGNVSGANVTSVLVTCATNTYTVGGTVSGLTGSGLVLKINGGETKNIAGDGGYAFTAIADGSAYSVTVATQPASPSQICSVANKTGNLAGANVGNVDVSCVVAYSIGGTVSGLGTSTGLVLRVNGGETVTVNADGGFTFPTLVGNGVGYSVTVYTQPNPALDCIVSSGSGTVAGAAVANIAVACKGWRTAGLVETDTPVANAPEVAYLPNGDALAVWYQQFATSPTKMLLASRFSATNGTWGAPERVDGLYYSVISQKIAIDANGTALVVWIQGNASGYYDLWSRFYYASGATWGTAALLESGSYDASFPQAAFDANGNAMVVWMQRDATNRADIWARRYAAGSGWEAEGLIETSDLGNAVAPQVAFDGSGNAIATWHQSDGTRLNVWANRYVSGSGWGAAALIETDNVGSAEYPMVAADAAGNAIVAWEHYNGSTGFNIVANRFNGATWGTPVTIETATYSQRWPDIAMDAAGNAVVIWREIGAAGASSVWANSYDQAGAAWGTATRIGNGGYDQGVAYLDVKFDATGNATAVWSQFAGYPVNTFDLYANRLQAGTWVGAKTVEAAGGDAALPSLSIDANGHAMVVWAQPSGQNSIWYNVYR